MAIPWRALVLGTLCAVGGCTRKTPPAKAERAAVATASASASPTPIATAYAVPEPHGPTSFEVEFEGTLKSTVKGARYVVLVSEQPCTPDNLGTVPTIAIGEARKKPKGLVYATEGNVREGSRGYVCATVLDEKGRAIGFGAYGKNPIVFSASGKDELEIEDLDVSVGPLVPGRELPGGRF